MSASPIPTPAPFLVPRPSSQANRVLTMPSRAPLERSQAVRRRPSREQGQALEILGHALEYLVDSRMFVSKERKTRSDGEAIHILSTCSREVFATCAEVVPMRQRIKKWVEEHLHLGQLDALGQATGRKA